MKKTEKTVLFLVLGGLVLNTLNPPQRIHDTWSLLNVLAGLGIAGLCFVIAIRAKDNA
jgi:hypothetical protein